MKHLPLPADAATDLAVITAVCLARGWNSRLSAWSKGYSDYQASGGNPWVVAAHSFDDPTKAQLRALYDTYSQSAELKAIRDADYPSCPMCGSHGTGDLDHYLPRKHYAEFSIQRANLVPACTYCNSGSKLTQVKGVYPERFVHPYFDAWANQRLWFVELVPPFEAVTFRPKPDGGLTPARADIVAFHLEHVLGKQFMKSMRTRWSSLPWEMVERLETNTPSTSQLTTRLAAELKISVGTAGNNAWSSALLRGVPGDITAVEFIRTRMNALQSLEPKVS